MKFTAAILLGLAATPILSFAQKQSSSQPSQPFVEVDGARLHYEECGSGPRAVLLMHDGVVNSAIWDDVWPSLCKHFHVVRYDRRGYGRSTATTKPYFEADDIAAILRSRKIGQVALVGSSHGGNVAMSFALRYPAQVSDLILVGPEAEGFPYSEHFAMAQMAFQGAKDPIEVRAQNTYFIAPGNEVARDHLRQLLKASPQDHTHDDMPLPERSTFPYVKDLRMPALIITGSADIADNQAVAGALVMTIPGASRVVVPDAGHLLYLEKPNVFASLVITFLTLHQF